ncbi:MAG: extracellular solute-binding protein [Oscillospiraceae bacterium]|nr:extracellular solute-binding protein [Oscillospiraceae bacterium]
MKNSANPEAAQAFLDYLRSDEATAVFAEVRLAAMSDPLPVAEATETEHVDLYVFAAASMTETLTKIKSMYEALHPNVTLVYNFDSSGTLKTQIEEGAECDLFISAAPKQMNQLDVSKAGTDANPDGLDFVLEGTRINLVGNTVVLAVPEGNPDNITSFDQLAELLKAVQG